MERQKDKIIDLIDNIIKSEYRKHKDLDWSKIASIKIYKSLFSVKIDSVDSCPECENQYPRLQTDGSYYCEECGTIFFK